MPPALLAVILALALAPPPPSAARLLAFDDLQGRLASPELRLLDPRPRAAYDRGHIPGAVWVDIKAMEALAGRPGALADPAPWGPLLAPMGLDGTSEVVVYDAARQLDAARLWWLLTYLGVGRVSLLDGGFPLWASQKRPTTTEVPAVAPRAFAVNLRRDRRADRADVLASLSSRASTILDARSAREYAGSEVRSKRGGHVPEACHLEWKDLVDADGRFLDEPVLRSKLAKAGVKPEAPVITHCQGGGRASVDAFVLERLGYSTRNYYLGWSDWGNAADTPVAGEPAGK